tara:strand:+ start:91 stop:351 length:261 start_codon:yes stop_codon:yes gene_type:complete
MKFKPKAERIGVRKFKNHTTGDYGEFEFISFRHNPDKPEGSVEGKIFNAKDELIYEIFGTEFDALNIRNCQTQEEEQLWKARTFIP